MCPQATGSNPQSVSIIFPPVRPSVCTVVIGPFIIFVFVLTSSVGVYSRGSFIAIVHALCTYNNAVVGLSQIERSE